jgi:POT family proton-dependent oligopeptide transporter
VLWRWRQLAARGREPQAVSKFAIGCAIFAFGFVWLAGADWLAGAGKVNALWPTLYHVIAGLGFLYFVPVCLSIISRAAPPAINGFMLAIFYCSVSVGSVASGALGRLYEQMTPPAFWLLHAAIVGTGSLVLILFHRPLSNALRET